MNEYNLNQNIMKNIIVHLMQTMCMILGSNKMTKSPSAGVGATANVMK